MISLSEGILIEILKGYASISFIIFLKKRVKRKSLVSIHACMQSKILKSYFHWINCFKASRHIAQSKLLISKDGTDFLVMYIDNRTYSQPIKIIHLTQVCKWSTIEEGNLYSISKGYTIIFVSISFYEICSF